MNHDLSHSLSHDHGMDIDDGEIAQELRLSTV